MKYNGMPVIMNRNAHSASQGAEKMGMIRRNRATRRKIIGEISHTRKGRSRFGSFTRRTRTQVTVHAYQNQAHTPEKLIKLAKPEPNRINNNVRKVVKICALSGVPNLLCLVPMHAGRKPCCPAAAAKCEYVYRCPFKAPRHENATRTAKKYHPLSPKHLHQSPKRLSLYAKQS